MRALVTGAAGFIGSHLCEALVNSGIDVVGVDSFTEFYDRKLKERNIRPPVRVLEADVEHLHPDVLDGVTYVFHLAGQPGVRDSWGDDFGRYVQRNILATKALLDLCAARPVQRFVFASTSAVYGDLFANQTMHETTMPRPRSPYGITKLAAEQLCLAYAKERDVPTVALRYFTVYGPRQRPDMAFSKFFRAISRGERIRIYGDPIREFTYVADVVEATLMAGMIYTRPGSVFNVGGGTSCSVANVIKAMADITGRVVVSEPGHRQAGEMVRTAADISDARLALGYKPKWSLDDGLRAQWEWMKSESAHADGDF